MTAILRLFVDLCLFQKAPQDIPASWFLFRLTVFLYLMTGFLVLTIATDWLSALGQVVVELALVLSFTWGLLALSHNILRFQKTAGALLGCDVLLSIIALPFLSWAVFVGAELAYIALLLLMLWHLFIIGHILRHALSTSMSFGVGLGILFALVSHQILTQLFPT